ncbi:hypothetical protein C8J57DRAFT_1562108 [Mycena rebaudengoi]|nr:hypothetical protein C8J57DRAFT_1562108 [Mycena rebaudengoi]
MTTRHNKTHPLLVYDAPALDRSLTGFDPSKLEDGTVTHVAATAHDSATISLNFAGTGVYVFVAYPSGRKDTAASAFLVQIDGVASGGWARGSFSDPLSGFLAYRNTTLSNGEHNFTIEIQPGWELYFDFLVYTSVVPDSTSTSRPVSSSLVYTSVFPHSTSTSPPVSPFQVYTSVVPDSTSTSPPVSYSIFTPASSQSNLNPSASPSKTKKNIPVGAVVGSAVGGSLLLALLFMPLLLRRRALAKQQEALSKQVPVPFAVGPDDRYNPVHKDSVSPPLARLVPAPGRFQHSGSVLTAIDIPPTQMSRSEERSPLSGVSEPAFLLMAEEVRRLTESVQRLETGIPEVRDGGPIFQPPPAYSFGESS